MATIHVLKESRAFAYSSDVDAHERYGHWLTCRPHALVSQEACARVPHMNDSMESAQASLYSPLPTMLPSLSPDMQISASMNSIHHDLTPSTIEPAATYSSAVSLTICPSSLHARCLTCMHHLMLCMQGYKEYSPALGMLSPTVIPLQSQHQRAGIGIRFGIDVQHNVSILDVMPGSPADESKKVRPATACCENLPC